MSLERRLVVFLLFSVFIMWGMPQLMNQFGLLPKPAKPPAAVEKVEPASPSGKPAPAAAALPDGKAIAPAKEATKALVAEAPVQRQRVEKVTDAELVLGSASAESPFHLEIQLSQKGAGVSRLRSSRHEAEIKDGQPRGVPLTLIDGGTQEASDEEPEYPPSFSMDLRWDPDQARKLAEGEAARASSAEAADTDQDVSAGKMRLDEMLWEVVPDAQGKLVGAAERPGPKPGEVTTGQQVVFRAEVDAALDNPLAITKTYRLWPGEDGLELELSFESPAGDQAVTYDLFGPHGLPIEGEWYTGTFRDVFFGGATTGGDQVITRSAYDVVKNRENPERVTSLPIKYAGVENQYFAIMIAPQPTPKSLKESWVAEARAVPVRVEGDAWMKADVTVVLESKPLLPAPNRPVRHTYRIYAGPKTVEALSKVDAFEISTYRKGWDLPVVRDLGAQFMSKRFIAPMLDRIYGGTAWVARKIGWERGNYGIAIILLTMVVRLLLFPLGRKQARAAQKMQELQPLLVELKAKYGDDKEQFTREQFALFKKHGVNPVGGCLPALVQLPVMIGLWQALNSSVALRHSRFLWIDNLAAPDMLFKFPFDIPLVGQWLGPYFNLLPIVVVALMLVQTKLFAPPATTPEAEAQQNMMKYMMIFMAFIFYKVPAGLGIYFITSSLWQICERLLLPKPKPLALAGEVPVDERSRPAKPTARSIGVEAPPVKGGWLAGVREKARQRMEEIVQEASKDRTVRNTPERNADRERDRDRNAGRGKPGKRPGKS